MTIKHVVLASGGMDSTTALALAIAASSPEEVMALSFLYGAKHGHREYDAAFAIAQYFGCVLHSVTLNHTVFEGSGSALLGESEMPNDEYQVPEEDGPSPTVVPFRNAVLISNAVAIAESIGATNVIFSGHASDHEHWAYPDCSPEFIGTMIGAVYAGTMGKVRLTAPFLWVEKATIVSFAATAVAPLHLTWSCYEGKELHCGTCPTCRERLRAFNVAGYIDPVEYANEVEFTTQRKFPYAHNYQRLPF